MEKREKWPSKFQFIQEAAELSKEMLAVEMAYGKSATALAFNNS